MIEAKIIDKDNQQMVTHSGDFCLCIVGTKEGCKVDLFGSIHIFKLAELAGTCMNTLFKGMAQAEDTPHASELIAKQFFLEKFFAEIKNEPKGGGAIIPDGPKNNNTIQ